MQFLDLLHTYARDHGQETAVRSGGDRLTYQQLDSCSGRLAAYIQESCGDDKAPVVVCGHKGIAMIPLFLAAVKSGRPYCPLDSFLPRSRKEAIIEQIKPSKIFAGEEAGTVPQDDPAGTIPLAEVRQILAEFRAPIAPRYQVRDEDVFYLLFTSGSTGEPKGVQITARNLDSYLDWSVGLVSRRGSGKRKVFLNQAPFSFDLSVMDTYTCLASGGTLQLLDRKTQLDFKRLFSALAASEAAVWVSTPSFADMCLVDKGFNAGLLPALETFLFCGETLTNATALDLMERFPKATIMNMYGPTETTVAVTAVEVTRELARSERPLPVGSAKPGTFLEIRREDGSLARPGEAGEIIIAGDTVSRGYFGREDLTGRKFSARRINGRICRAYHTGDKGWLDERGMLHYEGRMDLQIKMRGYRIELEDIEKNILRIPGVTQAIVVPKRRDGRIHSLTAFVTGPAGRGKAGTAGGDAGEKGYSFARQMKKELKAFLPDYMIPKNIVWRESLPMNANGKADRKRLAEERG